MTIQEESLAMVAGFLFRVNLNTAFDQVQIKKQNFEVFSLQDWSALKAFDYLGLELLQNCSKDYKLVFFFIEKKV